MKYFISLLLLFATLFANQNDLRIMIDNGTYHNLYYCESECDNSCQQIYSEEFSPYNASTLEIDNDLSKFVNLDIERHEKSKIKRCSVYANAEEKIITEFEPVVILFSNYGLSSSHSMYSKNISSLVDISPLLDFNQYNNNDESDDKWIKEGFVVNLKGMNIIDSQLSQFDEKNFLFYITNDIYNKYVKQVTEENTNFISENLFENFKEDFDIIEENNNLLNYQYMFFVIYNSLYHNTQIDNNDNIVDPDFYNKKRKLIVLYNIIKSMMQLYPSLLDVKNDVFSQTYLPFSQKISDMTNDCKIGLCELCLFDKTFFNSSDIPTVTQSECLDCEIGYAEINNVFTDGLHVCEKDNYKLYFDGCDDTIPEKTVKIDSDIENLTTNSCFSNYCTQGYDSLGVSEMCYDRMEYYLMDAPKNINLNVEFLEDKIGGCVKNACKNDWVNLIEQFPTEINSALQERVEQFKNDVNGLGEVTEGFNNPVIQNLIENNMFHQEVLVQLPQIMNLTNGFTLYYDGSEINEEEETTLNYNFEDMTHYPSHKVSLNTLKSCLSLKRVDIENILHLWNVQNGQTTHLTLENKLNGELSFFKYFNNVFIDIHTDYITDNVKNLVDGLFLKQEGNTFTIQNEYNLNLDNLEPDDIVICGMSTHKASILRQSTNLKLNQTSNHQTKNTILNSKYFFMDMTGYSDVKSKEYEEENVEIMTDTNFDDSRSTVFDMARNGVDITNVLDTGSSLSKTGRDENDNLQTLTKNQICNEQEAFAVISLIDVVKQIDGKKENIRGSNEDYYKKISYYLTGSENFDFLLNRNTDPYSLYNTFLGCIEPGGYDTSTTNDIYPQGNPIWENNEINGQKVNGYKLNRIIAKAHIPILDQINLSTDLYYDYKECFINYLYYYQTMKTSEEDTVYDNGTYDYNEEIENFSDIDFNNPNCVNFINGIDNIVFDKEGSVSNFNDLLEIQDENNDKIKFIFFLHQTFNGKYIGDKKWINFTNELKYQSNVTSNNLDVYGDIIFYDDNQDMDNYLSGITGRNYVKVYNDGGFTTNTFAVESGLLARIEKISNASSSSSESSVSSESSSSESINPECRLVIYNHPYAKLKFQGNGDFDDNIFMTATNLFHYNSRDDEYFNTFGVKTINSGDELNINLTKYFFQSYDVNRLLDLSNDKKFFNTNNSDFSLYGQVEKVLKDYRNSNDNYNFYDYNKLGIAKKQGTIPNGVFYDFYNEYQKYKIVYNINFDDMVDVFKENIDQQDSFENLFIYEIENGCMDPLNAAYDIDKFLSTFDCQNYEYKNEKLMGVEQYDLKLKIDDYINNKYSDTNDGVNNFHRLNSINILCNNEENPNSLLEINNQYILSTDYDYENKCFNINTQEIEYIDDGNSFINNDGDFYCDYCTYTKDTNYDGEVETYYLNLNYNLSIYQQNNLNGQSCNTCIDNVGNTQILGFVFNEVDRDGYCISQNIIEEEFQDHNDEHSGDGDTDNDDDDDDDNDNESDSPTADGDFGDDFGESDDNF